MICINCGATLTSPTGVSLILCPFCHTDNSTKKQNAASRGEIDLRNEFLRRGESLYKDKRILVALINDYFAENQKFLKVLRLAVQDNIAAKIVDVLQYRVGEQRIRISAIISYFAGDYDMNEARVAEVVRILAFGAGFEEDVLDGITKMASGEHPVTKEIPEQSKVDPLKTKLQLPQIGSVQSFGGYNWQVLDLDIRSGQALLLSELILEKRPYHKEQLNITWENCTLRYYLNNNFYSKLSINDRNRITQRNIANYDNPWFGIKGGNNTSDKIFLLSIEEMVQYLGDSGQLQSKPNEWWIIDQYNDTRIAQDADGVASWWWLRSPGNYSGATVVVYGDGRVDISGYGVGLASGGVRPALWLNCN